MNANIDSLVGSILAPHPAATFPTISAKVSSLSGPPPHKNNFKSYDDEWAAFLAQSSLKKTRAGTNYEIPETLPRVWNNPQ